MSALSATPPQPSFQIRAAPSLGNVTFSWRRLGRDGGSGKGWTGGGRKTNGERGTEERVQVLRWVEMEGWRENQEAGDVGGKRGFHLLM